MLRRFIVNVNGTAYDVEVEEVGGVAGRPAAFAAPSPYANANTVPMYFAPSAPAAAPVAPAPAPAPATAPAPAPAPAPAAPVAAPAAPAAAPAAAPSAGQTAVTAPMPGNILDIKVNVGDTVSADDVVIILEAMKMENEIFAPASGKVVAINTTKGASVNSGDCLIVIG